MYLETIIDQPPHLQIIYHYPDDDNATLLETTWEELDKFCTPFKPYEIKLECFDFAKSDISQAYCTADCKTWLDHLPKGFKTDLIGRFIQYCEQCDTTCPAKFFQ